jgi:hypothetical protein
MGQYWQPSPPVQAISSTTDRARRNRNPSGMGRQICKKLLLQRGVTPPGGQKIVQRIRTMRAEAVLILWLAAASLLLSPLMPFCHFCALFFLS